MRRSTAIAISITAATLLVSASSVAQTTAEREKALYDRAVTAFQGGDYDRAARLFGELYTMNPNPLVLYNRAYALGRAHNYAAAVEAAALVELSELDEQRLTKNRARLVAYRGRISSEQVAEEVAAAPAVAVVEEPSETPRSPWLAGALVTGVIGAGGWITTVALDASIGRDAADLEAAEESGDDEAAAAALSTIESRQAVARPVFVIAAVSTAAAATFLVIHLTRDREAEVVATPTSVGLRYSF